MKCCKCKAEIPNGSKFCMECGTEQIKGKTCSNCGMTGLPEEALFCPNCGEIISNLSPQEVYEFTSSDKKKSSTPHQHNHHNSEKEVDKDDIQIGDFFYSDGTTSHVKDSTKKLVGRVFTLQTTETEKQHGWTHGQILAVKEPFRMDSYEEKYGFLNLQTRVINYKTNCFEWGNDTDNLPQPHKHIDSLKEAVNDRDGYLYTYSGYTKNKNNYPAFEAARKFRSPLPLGKTSGWYLPALGQLLEIFKNLGNLDFGKFPNYHRNTTDFSYAEFNDTPLGQIIKKYKEHDDWYSGWLSSSEKDDNYVWTITDKGVDSSAKYIPDSEVHPVAAF